MGIKKSVKWTDMTLTPKTIWQEKQNKPTYIVRDLSGNGLLPDFIYAILLKRGVFKWLAVRRELIRLKNKWRDEITKTIENIQTAKKLNNYNALLWYRGYLKALEDCRKSVRELCHSDRWQAPDNDKKAKEFLRRLTNEH